MKLKKMLLVILLFFIIFLGVNQVSALNLELKGDSTWNWTVTNKLLNSKTAYCIDGPGVNAKATTCSASNKKLSVKERSVIAQIIKKYCSGGCSSFGENYVKAEVAITSYLIRVANKFTYGFGDGYDTFKNVIDSAIDNETSDIYNKRNAFKVEFDADELEFSKKGGYYQSQKIELTNIPYVMDSTVKLTVDNGATIEGTYDEGFVVKIPESSVSEDLEITLKTGDVKQHRYYIADEYNCAEGQDVVLYNTGQSTGQDEISGTINLNGTLKIKKIDSSTGNYLSGAKIKVTGPNGFSETYTTTGEMIVRKGLEPGEYTITEISAPSGYYVAEAKKVTITAESLTKTVTLKNNKNKVVISKVDHEGKAVSGASLEIQDEKGNIVKYCTNNGLINQECKWTSTGGKYEITGFPVGTYYLVETKSPEGYLLSEKVKFTIDASTKTKQVEMKNIKTTVKFSKINIVDKKELPGATLRILDQNKQPILGADGKPLYEWVSKEEPHYIYGLQPGKYYLQEVIAPEGFVLSSTMVEFEVKADGSVTEVVMENSLEVPVPDTLSSRSTLLLTIAMFDIALGIGIILYVKKNKITE